MNIPLNNWGVPAIKKWQIQKKPISHFLLLSGYPLQSPDEKSGGFPLLSLTQIRANKSDFIPKTPKYIVNKICKNYIQKWIWKVLIRANS